MNTVLLLTELLIVLSLTGCNHLDNKTVESEISDNNLSTVSQTATSEATSTQVTMPIGQQPTIDTREFLSEELLQESIRDSSDQVLDSVAGGIVPHHDVAYQMMADFYRSIQDDKVSLVVLIGPNHFGRNDGVLTYKGLFETYDGTVETSDDLIQLIVSNQLAHIDQKQVFSTEHSLNIQMGFIANAFPSAQVLPILIGEEHNAQLVDILAENLKQMIDHYNGTVMIIGTVDFAHYLDVYTTEAHDLITKELIAKRDYTHIMGLDDGYVDSPSVLVLTMKLLEDYSVELLDASHSEAILGYESSEGLTSYQTYVFKD